MRSFPDRYCKSYDRLSSETQGHTDITHPGMPVGFYKFVILYTMILKMTIIEITHDTCV